MEEKEKKAKEYADRIPHYQDRKQQAAEDFLAGWEAAEGWRTDKENAPDGKSARESNLIKYWKPLQKLPEEWI